MEKRKIFHYYGDMFCKKFNFVAFRKQSGVKMVTYCLSSHCIAAVFNGPPPRDLRRYLSCCLLLAGFRPWSGIEGELFVGNGQVLLMARPRSPLRIRLGGVNPRLSRN